MAVALREFKRDKISKQNARLSLANSVYDNPQMPRRKILLSTGGNNYRPPLERSKSAPKLMAIEEIIEEDEEETEEGQVTTKQEKEEVPNCCKEDYLYPSITLGRRRCRRGHSIRRARLRISFKNSKSYPPTKGMSVENVQTADKQRSRDLAVQEDDDISKSLDCDLDVVAQQKLKSLEQGQKQQKDKPQMSGGSDEDFESFLLYNNYDSKDPLTGDLMSYFDMKLQHAPIPISSSATAVSLHDLSEDISFRQHHCQQRGAMSLDNLADYSDNELDNDDDDEDDVYFNQESLLATLRRQSKSELNKHFILNNKSVNIYDKTDVEPNCSHNDENNSLSVVFTDDDDLVGLIDKLDSDEGSISSGCETSSTVTTNTEELNGINPLPRRGSVLDRVRSYEQLAENNHVTKEPIGERVIPGNKYFKRAITFPTPNGGSSSLPNSFMLTSGEPTESSTDDANFSLNKTDSNNNNTSNRKIVNVDCDSDEFSDESGYCEMISKTEGSTKNQIVRRMVTDNLII